MNAKENNNVKDEMLKVLIDNGKQVSFQFPLKNYKLILNEFWDMDDLDNLKNGKKALEEYEYLFEEEIEAEQEEEEQPTRYGLGLFGTLLAILVGIVNAFSKKK